jgi:hypothetical protein
MPGCDEEHCNMYRRFAAVLVVGLAACGGGGEQRASTLDPSPSTTESPATTPPLATTSAAAPRETSPIASAPDAAPVDDTASTVGLASSTAPPTVLSPSVEDLGSRLLTVEDLPTGWSPYTNSDDEDTGEGCDAEPSLQPDVEAETTFSQGSFGPFLVESLGLYGDDRAADDAVTEFRAMTERCQSYTTTEDDGSTTTVTFSPLSFPKLGDDTYAVHMDVAAMFPIAANVVLVRDGDVLMIISHAGMMAVDATFTEAAVRMAHDKLS